MSGIIPIKIIFSLLNRSSLGKFRKKKHIHCTNWVIYVLVWLKPVNIQHKTVISFAIENIKFRATKLMPYSTIIHILHMFGIVSRSLQLSQSSSKSDPLTNCWRLDFIDLQQNVVYGISFFENALSTSIKRGCFFLCGILWFGNYMYEQCFVTAKPSTTWKQSL